MIRSKAYRSKAFGLVLLALGTPALGCEAGPGERAGVSGIAPTGDILASNGRLIRLAGIAWPERGRGRERERLVATLGALLLNEPVRIVARGEADRWGRVAADVFVERRGGGEPLWVQGELAEDGLARIWPEAAGRACWSDLREREYLARQAGTGLWAALATRPGGRRLSAEARAPISRRIVYEGRVHSVRKGRSVTFVNFAGPRDVTPSWLIDRRLEADLLRSGRDPATFAGKRLILRAELSAAPRPRLTVTMPEAVEVIE